MMHSGPATDVLGDDMVAHHVALMREAMRAAAADPEPAPAMAALSELYVQLLAHVIVWCVPPELRKDAVHMASLTLQGMVLEEMKNDASFWMRK